jgi:putative two-component system response regulator
VKIRNVPQAGAPQRASPGAAPPTILLVEDSPTQALRTRLALESAGFRVTSARDGKEALELAHIAPPDAILSDILMPRMDGFELCREIRLDPDLRAIPVILTTSTFSGDEDRLFAVSAGADGCIQKDTSPEALGSCLRAALARPNVRSVAGIPLPDDRTFHDEHTDKLRERLLENVAALEQAYLVLSAAYDATLEALVAALDLRDTETELHSWRVTEYTLALARRLGVQGKPLDYLRRGSVLHDIGKIGVPDHILRKPGPLDESEWAVMRTHPELGYRILVGVESLREPAQIVLAHHERWDGGGYPRRLRGEAIPLGARIFAVADTIDAITSDRPYRAGRGFDAALEEIDAMRGTQLDPAVVDVALGIDPEQWAAIRSEAETLHLRKAVG